MIAARLLRFLLRFSRLAVPAVAAAVTAAGLPWGGSAAIAEACAPHCDYNHYYGPYDFTYTGRALFGWPRCDARGNCAPHLAYTTGLPWPRQIGLPARVGPRP